MFISDGDISIDCNAVQNCHAPQATPNRTAIQLCRRAESVHSHTIVCASTIVYVIFPADNCSVATHEKVKYILKSIRIYLQLYTKLNLNEMQCQRGFICKLLWRAIYAFSLKHTRILLRPQKGRLT